MEPNTTVLPGVFGLIKQSLAFYKKNFKNLALIGLVFIAISVVSYAILAPFILNFEDSQSVAFFVIFFIIVFIIGIANAVFKHVIKLAFTKASIEYDADRVVSVKELYKIGFRFFWPAVWIAILVGLVILGTSVFLLIPGLVLSAYLTFSIFVLMDTNQRGLSALATSFYYVKNNFWRVLWRFLGLALIVLGIAILIIAIIFLIYYLIDPNFLKDFFATQGPNSPAASSIREDFSSMSTVWSIVINLVAGLVIYCFWLPFVNFYTYSVYKFLKSSKPAPVPETDLKKGRNWFMGLSIFGTVMVGLVMIAMILIPLVIGIVTGYQNAKMRANNQLSPNLQEMQIEFKDKTNEKMPAVSTGKVLNNEDYVHNLLKFSIKPPQGWITQEGETLSDGIVMSDASEEILTKAIQVQYFEGEFASSDEEASAMIKGILQNSPNVDSQSISSSKVYIGPRLTYRFDGKMSVGRDIQYNLVSHETGVYIITAGWQNDISAEDKQMMKESISTFRALE